MTKQKIQLELKPFHVLHPSVALELALETPADSIAPPEPSPIPQPPVPEPPIPPQPQPLFPPRPIPQTR